MKCEACGGKGFIEYNHGLMCVGCDVCKGTGEIDARVDGIDTAIGVSDTSEPPKPRKRKAKKKSRKGNEGVLPSVG